MKEHERLEQSDQAITEMLEMGRRGRDKLGDQNSLLKNVKTKMFDVITALGSSSSLVGNIDLRARADRLLLFGCMAFTVLLFFFLLWLSRGGNLLGRLLWFIFGWGSGSGAAEGVVDSADPALGSGSGSANGDPGADGGTAAAAAAGGVEGGDAALDT